FVKDNGPGIGKQDHDKIFGLFQRLDESKEGTGVGLAIVKRIMEKHGGRGWVESAIGEGATFWLAFPARVGEAAMSR
ncbi:MAG: ATP-binding protein, partial [Planctomycetaceae bacterium]